MSKLSETKISRRRLMIAGAGAAGAVAVVAASVPATGETPAASPDKKATLDQGGGYQETQHVLRYYQTARV
jgi:hypothetical protein